VEDIRHEHFTTGKPRLCAQSLLNGEFFSSCRYRSCFYTFIGGCQAWVYGPILGFLALIFVIMCVKSSMKIVKEKETMVIERFGKFHTLLTPGIHFIIPFVDRPRVGFLHMLGLWLNIFFRHFFGSIWWLTSVELSS